MPADNQLGGHGDMWSHCFPEGILLWMQHLRIIFDFNAMDMMQIFKSIPMVVNWYKTEIAQYFYKWCFFYIYYQTENMNRKGIMWVKASEGTAMPCGFTRHPQHGMGKSPSKCYNITLYLTIPIYTCIHIFSGVAFIIERETGYSLLVDVFVGWLANCCAQYTQMRHTCWVVLSVWWKYPWEHVTNVW